MTKVITLIWEYSFSLWEHRNRVLHGHTLADAMARELEEVKNEITEAYNDYKHDHFIIPSHFSSLFTSRSLKQRLQLDMDSMQCWLCSFQEAKEIQQEAHRHYSESAKRFFQPRNSNSNVQSTQITPMPPTVLGSSSTYTASTNSNSTLASISTEVTGSTATSERSIPTSVSIAQ